MALLGNTQGNYRFLPGVAPYSSGVVAMAGHEIVHCTVRALPHWRDGFALIEETEILVSKPETNPTFGWFAFNRTSSVVLRAALALPSLGVMSRRTAT